jgi:peptidyl-tRNA hydrolase
MDRVKVPGPCEAAGMGTPCWGGFDPAHTGEDGGGGMKSSDYSCVRLCRGHHKELDERQRLGVFGGWTDEQRAAWAAPRVWATQNRIGIRLFLDVLGLAVTFRSCPASISARPEPEDAVSARPNPDPVTHYVIVRRDLPTGVIAAQVVHAAGESSPGNLGPDTYAVVLAVENEVELLALDARLAAQGVARRAIREPDMGDQMTAIGLVPGPKSQVGRWVSSIPLYR